MKIFGIGLSKTGTTSLARALEILEYRTKDNLGVTRFHPNDISSIDMHVLDSNDAFTDTPIPSLYRELDAKYPNSKFILTVREDVDGWLKSCRKQFTQKLADKQNEAHSRLFMDLYGCTVFNEEKFRTTYNTFVDGVLRYFRDRPQDLLILDVAAGNGWEQLCPFLGKPTPPVLYPKANVTQIRWMSIHDIVAVAEQAGREALGIYCFMHGAQVYRNTIELRAFQKLRYSLHRSIYRLRADRNLDFNIVTKAACNIVVKALSRLNSKIPIITAEGSNIPYSERRQWNHLWLVDIVCDNKAPREPPTGLSVSIALIEDNTPILGVVYAPTLDILYYATRGKGAFLVECGGTPTELTSARERNLKSTMTSNRTRSLSEKQDENRPVSANTALAMCSVTEAKHDLASTLLNTMEWQTAAAHAILRVTGMTVISCATKEELAYNKEYLANGGILVQ